MLQFWAKSGYIILSAFFLSVFIVQTNFTETPEGTYLVSTLHLFEFQFLWVPRFKLEGVGFLSHDFVCESSSSHPRLVIVCVQSHEVFAFCVFSFGSLFYLILQNFELWLWLTLLSFWAGRARQNWASISIRVCRFEHRWRHHIGIFLGEGVWRPLGCLGTLSFCCCWRGLFFGNLELWRFLTNWLTYKFFFGRVQFVVNFWQNFMYTLGACGLKLLLNFLLLFKL